MKRAFDFTAAAVGLVVLSPVFLVVTLAIKLSTPGPVFFRQARVGRHGRIFEILKFRTMVADAERRGGRLTVGGDARITRVGAVLRRHKLDELPQLLNVLRGEMALVGPRPEVQEYVDRHFEDYAPLLAVRPGITHRVTLMFRNEEEILAQVHDPAIFYDRTIMPSKIRLYRDGLRNQNLTDDIFIILATIFNWPVPGVESFVLVDSSAVETFRPEAMAASAGGADTIRRSARGRDSA